ncbi:5'-methylthioadenosine/S-adenosylhomocysteine nucleosidase [Dongshaea marina]|uniref:5'-methylthioadenosine/S-adenosylhomocysteine nucleosidase n=1 Tax=Dongshaea marina TaxID=2047966 RepID=UPI000D3EBC21|nr:5'-methylthioadenosine/S-adenosylhomocysteine nucleosidase [Dongshaea marina]
MKIGIIGAMDQEVELLKQQMQLQDTFSIAGCEFYHGTLDGVEVILTRSGIGKVAASIATTLLAEKYAPDYVINTGSAGGFDPELNVGDIVISSELRHHDVDLTGFGYEMGQCARMPAAYPADAKLVSIAHSCIDAMGDVQTKEGLICTGDQFMCDPERIAAARGHFPDMLAVEMEGAAIAQVCYQFGIPFVVIRSLSDIAGKESPDSFEAYLEKAAKHSSKMVMAILNGIKTM